MRKIISIVFLFLCLNVFGQGVRYNISDEALGIQTPYMWKVYAHSEARVFSHPLSYNLRIYGITAQAGYCWMHGERAAFRSGGEITFWGYGNNNYNYFRIVPVAVSVFPFDRNYLGVDLQSKFNPYNFTFDTGLTVVVRIN